MGRSGSIFLSVCAIGVIWLSGAGTFDAFAQNRQPATGDNLQQAQYYPYPEGLMPGDLNSELDRVNREVDRIFEKTLAEWRALQPPPLASRPQEHPGTPPIHAGDGMRAVQLLGKLELFDKTISVNRNLACSTCHMPYAGFSGPISSVNATTVAYPGSVHFRFGKRKPQSYTYSPFYPPLDFDEAQQDFYGGNFWDLRSTGYKLQSPDAEQAQHPVVDTQEHGFPDPACVVFRISQSVYRPLFETIWGSQAFDIAWPENTEQICSTPGGAAVFGGNPAPVALSRTDRGRADTTFDQFALSITAYERSGDVSAFSSKFDAFLAGEVKLSKDEMAGWQLFRGKGKCNTCHLDGTGNSKKRSTRNNVASKAPLFTDFTSSNLGIPRNRENPFYLQTKPDGFGFTANPSGADFVDLGVGLFLRSQGGTVNPNSEWTRLAPKFDGKFQVVTTRNVDMRPCPSFVKAYMHNGYLKSLKEVVHFYNTRDKFAYRVESGHCPAGTIEKVNCWPRPEVSQNMDRTIGNLRLTDREEDQIVAFMRTLTDGYARPYTDFDAFTGSCGE